MRSGVALRARRAPSLSAEMSMAIGFRLGSGMFFTMRDAVGTRHRPDASGVRRRITKEPFSAQKGTDADHDPRDPCPPSLTSELVREDSARFDAKESVRSAPNGETARNSSSRSTRATAAERDALHPKVNALLRSAADAFANVRSPSPSRATAFGERWECDPLGGGRVLALSFIR